MESNRDRIDRRNILKRGAAMSGLGDHRRRSSLFNFHPSTHMHLPLSKKEIPK